MRAALAVLVFLPLAARAESRYLPREIIDRPLMLPSNVVELDVLGNLSTTSGASAGSAAAVGIELGLGVGEAGLVVALPAAPGLGLGSIFGSAAWSIRKDSAFRIDLGFEHSQGDVGRPSENFYTGGAGLIFSGRLSHEFALEFGQTRAINFGRFVNVSLGGTGFYTGASAGFDLADVFVYTSEEDGRTQISLSAPFGLLWQALPELAATLRFGYEVAIFSEGSRDGAQHFVPVGIDLVLTPVQTVDVGASFSLAGQIAQTGATASAGFTDAPMGALWLRLRL